MTALPPIILPAERERAKAAKPPRARRRTWKQFGVALGALAYVFGVALGTLLLGGLVVHALLPHRRIDMFAALHNHIVLGVLLGLGALWLLPPYPWAKPPPPTENREPAQSAGETEAGGAIVADLSQYRAGTRLAGPRAQEGEPRN